MLKKKCSKCRQVKELSAFYNNRCNKDGKQTYCKECKKAEKQTFYNTAYQKKYYALNKERLKEYALRYYYAHTPSRLEYNKLYHQTHKEECKTRNKKYNETHKEERKKQYKEYRKTHPINKEARNKYSRKITKKDSRQLGDNYIKKLLCKNRNIRFRDIPKEVAEEKRQQIKLYRFIRNFERKYLCQEPA